MTSPTHFVMSCSQQTLCYQPHPPWAVICTANILLPAPPTLGCHCTAHTYQPHPLCAVICTAHFVTSPTHFVLSSAQQTLCYQPHPLCDVICTAHTLLPAPPTLGCPLHSTHPVTSPTHFVMTICATHNLWPAPPTLGCHTAQRDKMGTTLCCANVLAPPPLQCT